MIIMQNPLKLKEINKSKKIDNEKLRKKFKRYLENASFLFNELILENPEKSEQYLKINEFEFIFKIAKK